MHACTHTQKKKGQVKSLSRPKCYDYPSFCKFKQCTSSLPLFQRVKQADARSWWKKIGYVHQPTVSPENPTWFVMIVAKIKKINKRKRKFEERYFTHLRLRGRKDAVRWLMWTANGPLWKPKKRKRKKGTKIRVLQTHACTHTHTDTPTPPPPPPPHTHTH